MIRCTVKRFWFGYAARDDRMLRRPRTRSPDCGIFEHGILAVDVVLRLEHVRIGSSPVAIQSRSNVFHIKSPLPSPLAFISEIDHDIGLRLRTADQHIVGGWRVDGVELRRGR
jgi:hypothetical protein